MGRFYRTSSANPLDYMYEVNTPLLERVVQANDQFIDQSMGGLNKLDQLSNYEHLIGDEQDAQGITKQYRDQVEQISQSILKDPANWRKQQNPMRDLSKRLQEDYTSGPISKQVYNYQQRKQAFDNVDKQVELYHTSGGTKGVSPERAKAYKDSWDNSFDKTDYNPTTGAYNVYKGGSVMDNIDVKKVLADGLDKIKADKSFQYREDEAGNGWYFNKVTNKVERITPEKILQVASGNISQDVLRYLAQDQAVGLVKGVYDDKGNFISPYSYSEVPLAPDEKAAIDAKQRAIDNTKNPAVKKQLQDALDDAVNQLKGRRQLDWNNNSYLTPILKGLTNQYSYSDVEQGNALKNNTKANIIYTQAQTTARNNDNLKMRWAIHQDTEEKLDKRAADRLAWDKEKVEKWGIGIPKATGTKTGGVKTGKDGKVEEVPTSVSKIATNSFESWTTTDNNGKTVPVLSIDGLSSDIDNKKKEQAQIDEQLRVVNNNLAWVAKHGDSETMKAPELQMQKEKLNQRKTIVDSELGLRRKWYQASTDAALSNHTSTEVNLQPEQVAVYNRHKDDPQGHWYTDKIKELKKEYDQRRVRYPSMPEKDLFDDPHFKDNQSKMFGLSLEMGKLEKEWKSFREAKELVDKGRENFLKNMRQDIIDTDAIQLGDKDSKDVSGILLSNTTGFRIFDSYGRSTDSDLEGKGISWFNSSGDNYKMTFSDNSLKDYIDRYNVKVNVRKIGNTTNIGGGNALAEVTFDDPGNEIPKDKVFYIEMTPEIQKAIGNKFKGNTNKDVANIANNMLDDEANNIRNQVMKPSMNRVLGKQDREEAVFTITVNGTKGDKLPLNVTRFTDGTGNHLFITDRNGTPMPTSNGTPGFFNGVDDFISQFRQQRQAAIDQMNKNQ